MFLLCPDERFDVGNSNAVRAQLMRRFARGAQPLGSSRIEIFDGDIEGDPGITLFIRTHSQLSERMRSVSKFQYPLHMLMNHALVYQKIGDIVKKGAVELYGSELMTAVLAGAADVGSCYGLTIDTEHAIVNVPVADISKPVEVSENPSASDMWAMALLIPDWPGLPPMRPPAGTLKLQVVHVPDVPLESLQDDELRRIVCMTLGWNFVDFAGLSAIEYFTHRFRTGLASATALETR